MEAIQWELEEDYGQGRVYFQVIHFSGFSFSLNYFFVAMLDILVAMGIIKSHHFVVDIFLIFGLCTFFYLSIKRSYLK